jgi:hypothetical protein
MDALEALRDAVATEGDSARLGLALARADAVLAKLQKLREIAKLGKRKRGPGTEQGYFCGQCKRRHVKGSLIYFKHWSKQASCPACEGRKVVRCNRIIPGLYKDCERCGGTGSINL